MPGSFYGWSDLLLLANQPALRGLGRGVQHARQPFDGGGLTTALLVFCGFFVCVWGVARLFVRSEGPAALNSARGLFGELCRAHQLTRNDRRLLTHLARHHRLADPAGLFLDARWLDPSLCGPAWQKHAGRLRELRLALFAGLASPVPVGDADDTACGQE